jgi:hypothetical protein
MPATNILATTVPIVARLLDGERVCSTHKCMLDIPLYPPSARIAHIIPGLASHLLLSIVTICNAGYTITYTKIGCTIMYCGQTFVCGLKCTRTGLWMIPLTPWSTTAPTAWAAASLPSVAMTANVNTTFSLAKYACYVHQLLFPPPAATLLNALATSTN